MANSVTMTYGDYTFSPVPLLSYNKEIIQNDNGDNLYVQYSGQLNGLLVLKNGGFLSLMGLLDELKAAVDCAQCKLLEIKCDENPVLAIYPQTFNLSVESGNWIQTIPYTISLTWVDNDVDGCNNPPYVKDTNDEWNIEPINDPAILTYYPDFEECSITGQMALFNLSHTVSAVGIPYCSGTGDFVPAIDSAKNWVVANLGLDTSIIDADGVLNNSGTYEVFDHFRQVTTNKASGSYSVTESWVVAKPQSTAAALPAKEEFSVDISEDVETGIININISGTITGFQIIDYDTGTVTTSRYENALTYWQSIQANLLCRAQYANTYSCELNFEPTSKTVGHNPTSGVITYSHTYNNRPIRLVPGSRAENVQISYENPTDVYVEHLILGRSQGPILQSLRTSTKSCQTVNVEITMSGCGPTGCLAFLDSPRDIVAENILCCLESSLTGSYDQVFKTNDAEQWEPFTRRYSRTVTWCYQNCGGTGNNNTNICQ